MVLCFLSTTALRAEEPTSETTKTSQQENPAIFEATIALFEYLKLQYTIPAENQKFTLISNVMKNKHDTAESAINNTR
jgi:hypothetical protein